MRVARSTSIFYINMSHIFDWKHGQSPRPGSDPLLPQMMLVAHFGGAT